MGQCKSMDIINDKLYIGNIFNNYQNIAIWDIENQELFYVNIGNYNKTLKETIGFCSTQDKVYHVSRSGIISDISNIDNISDKEGDLVIEGDYIDVDSNNSHMYLLSTNKENRSYFKIKEVDLKSMRLVDTMVLESKKELIPQVIYLEKKVNN